MEQIAGHTAHSVADYEDSEIARHLTSAALAVAAFAGLAVTVFPHIDIAAARLFFDANAAFIGKNNEAVEWARNLLIALFVSACLLTLAGIVITRDKNRDWLGIPFMKWVFLLACLAIGPGVVSNLTFKNNWGRARPSQIVEFGGTKLFTPALQPARECERNCSFVSGEASSMFMLFFAGAFLYRRSAGQFITAGVVAGATAGLIRMAQGGHFLSDVIFAGVLMALTAAALIYALSALASSSRGVFAVHN